MINKLTTNEYKLLDIQKKIINLKLNLLDETFTFNKNVFDLEYLVRLNEFLFSDFYYESDFGLRVLSNDEISTIEWYLEKITSNCINNPSDTDSILNYIEKIWYLQPFVVGNTRTMIGYLKMIDICFLLGLDIDVNVELESKPSIFKSNYKVNQKRLTKSK